MVEIFLKSPNVTWVTMEIMSREKNSAEIIKEPDDCRIVDEFCSQVGKAADFK